MILYSVWEFAQQMSACDNIKKHYSTSKWQPSQGAPSNADHRAAFAAASSALNGCKKRANIIMRTRPMAQRTMEQTRLSTTCFMLGAGTVAKA